MNSSWQTDAGQLSCHWSQVPGQTKYDAPWMREASNPSGSYLRPLPDFASHCSFCGAFWFLPEAARQDAD